ncbi:MAG: EVE domain-containing protein [Deltaproteobacteria bacterium]|nr:MAG: EVE domain-containing protein [Deltaproteobacteria bacterium]
MPRRPFACFLVKSEPDAYSIDDLARERRAPWDGVRNYQARNIMRDRMKKGDPVFFYHSNASPPGLVGLARVASAAKPDPTQFDPSSPAYDPRATPDAPRWWLVDLEFVEKFPRFVPLAELRADPALDGMELLRRGSRLSVQEVEDRHALRLLELAGARSRWAKRIRAELAARTNA